MRIKINFFLISVLILSGVPPTSSAQMVNACKIQPSTKHFVSLGFPFNPPRLSNFDNPKVLVVPFRLKGETEFKFGNLEKNIFTEAKKNIDRFSNGRNKVEFTFNKIIDLTITAKDMSLISPSHLSKKETWQERYDESTWGFVSKFLKEQDSQIDYSGFNAVILVGNSSPKISDNGEAMIMTKDLYGPWMEPMETQEGPISNVVLLYNNLTNYALTHEIMHLYGLTDLYGSQNGVPVGLMKGGVIDLLAWEKWVLGWLGDENVQCISETSDINLQSVNNIFSIDFSSSEQLWVIPTGSTTALVLDLVKRQNRSWLSFYSIDNDARPPIAGFSSSSFEFSTEITKNQGVGTLIRSPKYTLLITENIDQKISFAFIPKSLSDSAEAQEMYVTADSRAKQISLMQLKPGAVPKMKITCKKGKSVKQISGLKPICPKGYKSIKSL